MSTTVQPPAHPWASAHRALLTALAIALALAIAITITLLVSRTTADQTIAPGGSPNEIVAPGGSVNVNPNGHLGHLDPPPVNRNERLGVRPR